MKFVRILIVLAVVFAVIKLFGNVPCTTCDGAGQLSGTKVIQTACPPCGGSGKRSWKLKRPSGAGSSLRKSAPLCLQCQGKGYTEEAVPLGVCPSCDGNGTEKLHQRMTKRLSANWEAVE